MIIDSLNVATVKKSGWKINYLNYQSILFCTEYYQFFGEINHRLVYGLEFFCFERFSAFVFMGSRLVNHPQSLGSVPRYEKTCTEHQSISFS